MTMNIAHIEERSFIYGPGCRYVIWTQGCSIRCRGCWNRSMWDFASGHEIALPVLFSRICAEKNNIEGITLLGGEPLDQYEETAALLRLCAVAGLSTVLFTGYRIDELMQKNMEEAYKLPDILITGRYDEQKRTDQHQWIGSVNQEIHFLSDRYKNYQINNANYMEISISEDGSLTILGFPKFGIVM